MKFDDPGIAVPRSRIASRGFIPEYLQRYRYASFQHMLLPPVAVAEGSPAAKENQLAFLLMDLRLVNGALERFVQAHEKRNWELSLWRVSEFARNRNHAVALLFGEFEALLARDHPSLGQSTREYLNSVLSELSTRFGDLQGYALEPLSELRLNSDSDRLAKIIDISKKIEARVIGVTGDLYLAAALPGAIHVGARIHDIPEFRVPFETLWKPIEKKILESPDELLRLQGQFPLLFRAPVENIASNISLEERLKVIRLRMMSEEMNLIRREEDALIIGVTKMIGKPLDQSAMHEPNNRNSLARQVEFKEQLKSFLEGAGLKIRFEYMNAGGFAPELARELEGSGWVLHSLRDELRAKSQNSCSGLLGGAEE